MALDHKAIQAAIDAPPATHNRNINIDTHVGQAPQRPYALLEDQMARVSNGYPSASHLRAALAGLPAPSGLPAGAPDPNEVEGDEGGLYRWVTSQDERTFSVKDGVLVENIPYVKRGVSLSMEGARIASQEGVPTDYFNGFTWLREGFKPEKDFQAMLNAEASGQTRIVSVPASPTDAARVRHEVGRLDQARPPVPVETSQPKRAAAREDK